MSPLVAERLLDSLLAPFFVAGLVMVALRGVGRNRLDRLSPGIAIIAGVGTAYVLTFGWPATPALPARSKIVIAAALSFVLGAFYRAPSGGLGLPHLAGAIAIPVWVGMPLLKQGQVAAALVLLPIIVALLAPRLIGAPEAMAGRSGSIILLTLAAGLAGIAAFGKAFSFAEISLALASTLLASLAPPPRSLGSPGLTTATAMLLGLGTALLLYSEANLPALMILGGVLGAPRLAYYTAGADGAPSTRHLVTFCLLPTIAALLIARIDAGPISLY